MRNRIGLALIFTGFLTGLPSRAIAQAKHLRWHDSLERGQAAAKASGKPIFVVLRCVR